MIRISLLPDRVWTLYRLTSPSGKVYIGQTVAAVERRWYQHCFAAAKEQARRAAEYQRRKRAAA